MDHGTVYDGPAAGQANDLLFSLAVENVHKSIALIQRKKWDGGPTSS